MNAMFDSLIASRRLESVKEKVLALRPELGERVQVRGVGSHREHSVLSIRTWGYMEIGLGWTREQREDIKTWTIFTASGIDTWTFWSTETSDDALAWAMVETFDHTDAETGQVKPPTGLLRWSEAEPGPATRLADALDARGIEVSAVVGKNRVAQWIDRQTLVRGHVSESVGEAVRIECQWGQATIAYRPAIGWVMDIPSMKWPEDGPFRWVLPHCLTRPLLSPGPAPSADRVEEVADVVAQRALGTNNDYHKARRECRHGVFPSSLASALQVLEAWGVRGALGKADYVDENVNIIETPEVVVLVQQGAERNVGKPQLSRRLGEIFGTGNRSSCSPRADSPGTPRRWPRRSV